MKEYAFISFSDQLSNLRQERFLNENIGKAMRLDKEGEPPAVMTSNGDIYYFLTEKNKHPFLKHKKYRVMIIS